VPLCQPKKIRLFFWCHRPASEPPALGKKREGKEARSYALPSRFSPQALLLFLLPLLLCLPTGTPPLALRCATSGVRCRSFFALEPL
jgi:hypothetical protein